jgi:hypothetical protein
LRYVVDLLGTRIRRVPFHFRGGRYNKIFLLRFDVSGLWREMSLDEEGR